MTYLIYVILAPDQKTILIYLEFYEYELHTQLQF